MEATGKVIAILPEQSGVSQRGTEWKSQEFVIEIPNGQFPPRRACFKLFGVERIANAMQTVKAGAEVTVSFDIDSREYDGRWFTSLSAWKVIPVPAAQPAPIPAPQAAAPATYPSTPAPAAVPPPVESYGDSLPF